MFTLLNEEGDGWGPISPRFLCRPTAFCSQTAEESRTRVPLVGIASPHLWACPTPGHEFGVCHFLVKKNQSHVIVFAIYDWFEKYCMLDLLN